MSADMIAVCLFFLTLLFNAGGFVWLAKNHMAHVEKALDGLTERVSELEEAVARIEGRLTIIKAE